jgi:hypothetical protein
MFLSAKREREREISENIALHFPEAEPGYDKFDWNVVSTSSPRVAFIWAWPIVIATL